MFILEIMLAIFIGAVTLVICHATGHKNTLGIMTKVITIFICIEIVVPVFMPVFRSAKSTAETVKKGVYSIEQKIDTLNRAVDKVDKTTEKMPALPKITPNKNGTRLQKFLYDRVLTEEEKRGN